MLGYISTILLILLYLLAFKNTSIFILIAYILIQSIIYILPFGLLKIFDVKHGKFNISIEKYYSESLFYIIIFDLILISIFLILAKK